ncbi:ATP-binding protein [Cryobacterium sp. CG_9.6]|uniref:sensor histidine kinase n=1 Tax=Cryobacterium sp. CG_9.6 TaxID=2760710 RepID=UPI002474768B|nr:ATP-binding protein [Cryobacterium sp. CG_9.6]MDH6235792.1 signal transduction histidine kinase [Cryobacterium sp. CG_9.6]
MSTVTTEAQLRVDDREPDPVADGARDRLARLMYAAVGGGAIIFGALSLQPFLAQAHRPSLGVSWLAWLLVCGLPIVSALLSRRAPHSVLRALALVHGAVLLSALVGWLILGAQALPQEVGSPWILLFVGVACVAIAVAERAYLVWVFVVVACTLSGLVRAVTTPNVRPALIGVEDGLYSLLVISVFIGFTLAFRRSARWVEVAVRLSAVADARAASRNARVRERQMIDALVHDSVISILLVAGLGRADMAVISGQAAATLSKLDALSGPIEFEMVPRSSVWLRLQALTAQLAPTAILRTELHLERMIPLGVGEAVLGAVGEALRNSVASAGVGHRHRVTRRVTVRPAGGGIQVLVTDDGAGFEPSLVPAERLGITQSIVGRMQRVNGGSAVVSSRPGRGTEVVITWLPPAAITALPLLAIQTSDTAAGHDDTTERPLTTPRPVTLPGTLGLSTPLARSVLALFIGLHAIFAFADTERVWLSLDRVGEVLALLTVSAAAVWIMLPAQDPFPRLRTVGILALCGVSASIMFLQVSPLDGRLFAHWQLGAVTLVLVVLVARGRQGWAWVGYAALAVATILWALAYGMPLADSVNLVMQNAGTLMVGSLFAVGLRRSARSLTLLVRERGTRASAEATSSAEVEEREMQLARVNALARPALERLMQATPLSPAEEAECLLVEASLRDAIRARSLFVEPIISATRAARSRGVEVTLLDDSGDSALTDVKVLAQLVAHELNDLKFGRFTVRILPAARVELATIVVESVEHRMMIVASDGSTSDA